MHLFKCPDNSFRALFLFVCSSITPIKSTWTSIVSGRKQFTKASKQHFLMSRIAFRAFFNHNVYYLITVFKANIGPVKNKTAGPWPGCFVF